MAKGTTSGPDFERRQERERALAEEAVQKLYDDDTWLTLTEPTLAARAHVHPHRAMCVTLECGHLCLMPKVATSMGVGALTGCSICPRVDGAVPERMVVKIEETGRLHPDWFGRNS